MKKLIISSLLLAMSLLSGCGYTIYAMPDSQVGPALLQSITEPNGATSSTADVTKTGEACASNFLGIVATGDFSIEAAKKAGGITTVSSVDISKTTTLYLVSSICTIVSGS
ncbi:MAG: TRL-like family protein [Alphaproteobacteria bacterium]|jgi:hypothetical protein|nr:TRL-like family protein [Alphaproteobacteria bacterium]